MLGMPGVTTRVKGKNSIFVSFRPIFFIQITLAEINLEISADGKATGAECFSWQSNKAWPCAWG